MRKLSLSFHLVSFFLVLNLPAKARADAARPQPDTQVIDCQKEGFTNTMDTRLQTFTQSINNVTGSAACSSIKKASSPERLSELNCKLLIECVKSKTNIDLLSSSPDAITQGVSFQLQTHIDQMENTELLRKFSAKKYGEEFASSCKSPLNDDPSSENSKDKCSDDKMMDEGFLRLQDKCSIGPFCYNSGVGSKKEYRAYMQDSKKKTGYLKSFFRDRTNSKTNVYLASDKEVMESLVKIIALETVAPSDKFTLIHEKLLEYEIKGTLNPIWRHSKNVFNVKDNLEKLKDNGYYSFFTALFAGKNSADKIRSQLEAYQKETAGFILHDVCPELLNYNDICKNAYDDAHDKNVPTGKYFPKSIKTHEDQENFVDAKGCINLKIVKNDKVDLVYDDSFDSTPDKITRERARKDDDEFIFVTSPKVIKNLYASNTYSNIDSERHDTSRPAISATPDSSTPSTEVPSKIETAPGGASLASLSSSQKTAPTVSNYSPAHFQVGNEQQKDASPRDQEEEKKTMASSVAGLNDKISALSHKLSSTEANLEKMRLEKEAAEIERVHQKEVDEQTTTITNLRTQISELKNSQRPKSISELDSVKKIESPIAANSSFTTSSRNSNSASAEGGTESYAPSSAESGSYTSVSSRGEDAPPSRSGNFSSDSGQSSSIRSPASTGVSNAIASTNLKSGVVLTKIEGLSSDKANETITEKIIELNGRPFYIEEGGMVKEIITAVKAGKVLLDDKGKPIFEKRVKGRVGDPKFGLEKIKGKAERVLGKIESIADLKHEEDRILMLHDRAHYKKLKEITRGAL
ncbi:MAG: hypothetical protein PHY93_17935 [Bacteriovorax sp.]|nr:hypothetical protein [Bacteriovorax sp.]